MSEGFLFTHYIVRVDVGPSAQHTAFAVIEQEVLGHGRVGTKSGKLGLRHLERLALGASYLEIVGKVKKITEAVKKQEGDDASDVVVDITGAGRGGLSLMRDEGINPIAVTIVGGSREAEFKSDDWRIAKTEFVSNLQLLYQVHTFETAEGLDPADTFVEEMLNFKIKSPRLSADDFEAWREGAHDDLVLAVAIAAWQGTRYVPPNRKAMKEALERHRKYANAGIV